MQQIPIGFVQSNCASCGIPSFFTEDFIARRRKDHKEFFCPSGHTNYFAAKSAEEVLKDQLQQEKTKVVQLERENNKLRNPIIKKRKKKTV